MHAFSKNIGYVAFFGPKNKSSNNNNLGMKNAKTANIQKSLSVFTDKEIKGLSKLPLNILAITNHHLAWLD